MISGETDHVNRWLKEQHIRVPDDWLQACIEWIHEENQGPVDKKQLNSDVYEQWLQSDFHEIQSSCLPTNLKESDKFLLEGFFCLQMDSIRDVGSPCYAQHLKLKGAENENASVDADQPTQPFWEQKPSRLLMMQFTDGIQSVRGMEYRSIQFLTTTLKPGTKILIHGKVLCRHGVLMLTAGNVRVLGGEVESLADENSQISVLSKALNNPQKADMQSMPSFHSEAMRPPQSNVNKLTITGQQNNQINRIIPRQQNKQVNKPIVRQQDNQVNQFISVQQFKEPIAKQQNNQLKEPIAPIARQQKEYSSASDVQWAKTNQTDNRFPDDEDGGDYLKDMDLNELDEPWGEDDSELDYGAFLDDMEVDQLENTAGPEPEPEPERGLGTHTYMQDGITVSRDDVSLISNSKSSKLIKSPQASSVRYSTSTPVVLNKTNTKTILSVNLKQEPHNQEMNDDYFDDMYDSDFDSDIMVNVIPRKKVKSEQPSYMSSGISKVNQTPNIRLGSIGGYNHRSQTPKHIQDNTISTTQVVQNSDKDNEDLWGDEDDELAFCDDIKEENCTDVKPREEKPEQAQGKAHVSLAWLTNITGRGTYADADADRGTGVCTYKVRAYIVRLLGKLEHHDGSHWSMPCLINDGTSTMEVILGHKILSELIGYRATDCITLKHFFKDDPSAKRKFQQGIKSCQESLIRMLGTMELKLSGSHTPPVVTDYSDTAVDRALADQMLKKAKSKSTP